MNLGMESVRRAAANLFPELVSHVWSSTVFLLAVLVILAVLRRRLTAGARFSLVLVGLAKFALPHAVAAAGVRRLDAALHIASRETLEAPLRVVAGAFRIGLAPPSETRLWPALVLGLWAAVALASLLRLARAHRLASAWARTALPPRPREAAALERARRRTGTRGPLGIARSPLPEAPAVLGIRRPLILLPLAGCDDLSDDELESLLRHECAHVVRRDNLIAGCTSVLCSLFWFHPLVWIARRILAVERERACDEIAVGSGEGKETYLRALAKFCHAAIGPELPGISRVATARIKGRIDHIMRYPVLKAQSPSPARTAQLAATVLALFTLSSGFAGSGPLAFAEAKARAPRASHTVRVTAPQAEALAEPAAAAREDVAQAVVVAPAPARDAGRAQDLPQGKAARRPEGDAVATAGPSSSHSIDHCPFVKCWITCNLGMSRYQYFDNTLACLSYSDAHGCRASGVFACSDSPGVAGC